MSYRSIPGLDKGVSPYAPYFGALVLLRLYRAGACPECFYMTWLLLRPLIQNPHPINYQLKKQTKSYPPFN